MNNSDTPASPITADTESVDGAFLVGLTKREYFAGLALQAFISTGEYAAAQGTAKESVQAADCLLYELENK